MPLRSEYEHGVPCWVDLTTPDDAAARAFYGDLFGWEWEEAEVPEGGAYWMAHREGQRIGGLSTPPPDQSGAPPRWNVWVNVHDLDEAAARVRANGGAVATPPFEVPGHGKAALVADPASAGFGLWEADGHLGAGLTDEHGAVVWHELLTPKPAAAVAFYGALFGWVSGTIEFPYGSNYTTLFLGIETIGGTAPPPEGGAPQWRVWFGSDDVAATVARADDLGGTILQPVGDSPIGAFAHLEDPSGAPFNVIAVG